MKQIFYYCLHDTFINWAALAIICFSVYYAINDLYKSNTYNDKITPTIIFLAALVATVVYSHQSIGLSKSLFFGLGVIVYLSLWYIISLFVTFIVAVLVNMLFKVINYVIEFLNKKGRS